MSDVGAIETAAGTRPWQPKLWAAALRATADPTQWALFRSKAVCDGVCAATPGWRSWAFDLGCKPGGTNQPKSFVATSDEVFFGAYARMAPLHRHAYEIVQGPCHMYFDLEGEGSLRDDGDELAEEVAAAACAVLTELAAAQGVRVNVEVVAIDSAHADKFSRHLVLLVAPANGGKPILLCGPRDAGQVAARVAARVGAAAAAIIDEAVYSDGRCLRLLGSAKLAGKHVAPLVLNGGRSSVAWTELPLAEQARRALAAPNGGDGGLRLLEVQPAPTAATPAMPARAVAAWPDTPCAAAPAASLAGAAAPAAVASSPDEEAWRRRWRRVTSMPLLDTRLKHPRVLERRRGTGLPPAPWAQLGAWAAAQLAALGCAGVTGWELVVADWPAERLLYVTGRGGRCAHVGRQHRSENLLLALDLLNGVAFQQCWDRQCVVRLRDGGYRKARAAIGLIPGELLGWRWEAVSVGSGF